VQACKPGERARFWKVAQFRSTSLYANLTAAELAEWKMYLKLEQLAGYRLVGELIRDWLQAERAHFAAFSPDGQPPAPPGGPEGSRDGRRQTIEDLSE